jgi:maltose O-acetyltransferase
MRQFTKFLALILYYGFARHLPASYNPFGLGIGKIMRSALCRCIFQGFGGGSGVERGVYFGLGSHVSLGAGSGIGIDARLYGPGKITIGDHVMFAPDVVVVTGNHRFGNVGEPIAGQGGEVAPVVIEDDVWIGLRVIILPGVTIGRSSVIAAGAVVAKDIPPFSIAGGVPAMVIRRRDGRPVSGDA